MSKIKCGKAGSSCNLIQETNKLCLKFPKYHIKIVLSKKNALIFVLKSFFLLTISLLITETLVRLYYVFSENYSAVYLINSGTFYRLFVSFLEKK